MPLHVRMTAERLRQTYLPDDWEKVVENEDIARWLERNLWSNTESKLINIRRTIDNDGALSRAGTLLLVMVQTVLREMDLQPWVEDYVYRFMIERLNDRMWVMQADHLTYSTWLDFKQRYKAALRKPRKLPPPKAAKAPTAGRKRLKPAAATSKRRRLPTHKR